MYRTIFQSTIPSNENDNISAPRPCPKGKTIRKHCKEGVARRTKTVIFYVSKIRCTKSLPPRCTQRCIRKVKRSHASCKHTCKGDSVKVTKCGEKRRFRTVVTIKYHSTKTGCKKRRTVKHYPCPVKCPKTRIIRKPCTKGTKYEVTTTLTYSVRKSCIRKGKCYLRCVRRVMREKKPCKVKPPSRRCHNPPARWTRCHKHSAYKYKTRIYYRNVHGTCIIYKKLTVKRLLCRKYAVLFNYAFAFYGSKM